MTSVATRGLDLLNYPCLRWCRSARTFRRGFRSPPVRADGYPSLRTLLVVGGARSGTQGRPVRKSFALQPNRASPTSAGPNSPSNQRSWATSSWTPTPSCATRRRRRASGSRPGRGVRRPARRRLRGRRAPPAHPRDRRAAGGATFGFALRPDAWGVGCGSKPYPSSLALPSRNSGLPHDWVTSELGAQAGGHGAHFPSGQCRGDPGFGAPGIQAWEGWPRTWGSWARGPVGLLELRRSRGIREVGSRLL